MIELGKKQTLLVVKSVEFGVYLAEDMNADTKHQVLLPAKQVPAGTKAGDKLEVFIYKDSQDRLIATTRYIPKSTVFTTSNFCFLPNSIILTPVPKKYICSFTVCCLSCIIT